MSLYLLDGTRTPQLEFRRFTPEDEPAWLPFFADPESTRYWEGIPPDPAVACRQQFERIMERYRDNLGGMNALVYRETGQLAGMCGLLVQEVDGMPELEIGYSLLPWARGRGLAAEAARHCRDTAWANDWSRRLISIIHVDNRPSMRVAESLGMTRDKRTVYRANPVWIYAIHRK